ncbi:MAG: DUF3486 family protein [Phyllobacteriaceae bacterium]|nr:DUF3486 family protein [Phyllobacteriaceae bacterium]
MSARRGRGRLSTIDQLPDEAQPAIAWAVEELRKRERPQTEILAEFNEQLRQLGTDPISKSAFNRYSMMLAQTTRRIEETHRIVSALGERLNEDASDDLTIMVSELGKTLVFELLQGAGEEGFSPRDAKELAMAARSFAQAQSVSSARRLKLEQEMADKVEEVTEAVAREAGLSEERAAELRRQVLGVRS